MDSVYIFITYILSIISPIELIASVIGIFSVYYTVKQNMLCWPTGIIMVLLYIYIFYTAKLYSDAILQIFFLFMQFYGWYKWKYGGKIKDKLDIKTLSNKWRILGVFGIIIVSLIWGHFMLSNTDAALPYADSFVLYISLTAQFLLSFKILESWVLWIIVDVISLFVYSIKGLYVTTGLYFIFLILAILGLIEWLKAKKEQKD